MNKRNFIKSSVMAVASAFVGIKPRFVFGQGPLQNTKEFTLPPLEYDYADLEPYIDAKTMEIHYTKHHSAYIQNLNKALEAANTPPQPIIKICENISTYPTAVRNNGGGHFNHSHFWRIIGKPNTTTPLKFLNDAILNDFKNIENMKDVFAKKAVAHFGSGWTWLILNEKRTLQIVTTPNQDNPLMDIAEVKGYPIIGLDVWEHAYYLKYQNKRADYVSAFWNVVNWEQAEKNYVFGMKKIRKQNEKKD